MPELPEVETVVRQLRGPILNKQIESIKIYDKQRLEFSTRGIKNSSIVGVERVAKEICLELSSGVTLAIHLRMTGRLIVAQNVLPQNTQRVIKGFKASHLRARFVLSSGNLDFVDPRRFGTIKSFKTGQGPISPGIEPLSDELNAERVFQISRGLKQPMKNFLLRQDKIVGLGNIYVSEILFASKLSPFMEAGGLDKKSCGVLVRNTIKILTKAIENCGTTFSDFQQTTGELGNYQKFLKVYNQSGKPCRRCRKLILKEMQAGRSTYYCEQCQKLT